MRIATTLIAPWRRSKRRGLVGGAPPAGGDLDAGSPAQAVQVGPQGGLQHPAAIHGSHLGLDLLQSNRVRVLARDDLHHPAAVPVTQRLADRSRGEAKHRSRRLTVEVRLEPGGFQR